MYLFTALIAEIFISYKQGARNTFINRNIVFFFFVIFLACMGILRQTKIQTVLQVEQKLRVALIQTNISQENKWDPLLARENLSHYVSMSDYAADGGADLAIWSETAYPYTIDLATEGKYRLIERGFMPIPVIMGAVTQLPQLDLDAPLVFNSAVLVGKDTQYKSVYHKRHLVPFGEYIPFKEYLNFAKRLTLSVGDFTPGTDTSLMDIYNTKAGILICYEDLFPELARSSVLQGAGFLVNLTNDAWYGHSSAQVQHLVFSQFRALENRRYVVRSTSTGISAMIDWRGIVFDSLPPFKEKTLVKEIPTTHYQTIYSRYGDVLAWLSLVFLSGIWLIMISQSIKGLFRKAVNN